MKSTKSLIRVHHNGEVVGTEKRVMYLDDVTYDWYIILNKQKVYVYPECDDSGDTYGTPYDRKQAQAYTYHENVKVIDGDGIVTRMAVYWKKNDTSTVWALDGREVVFSFILNAYIVVTPDAQAALADDDQDGEPAPVLTPAQASEAAVVALAHADEEQWLEQKTAAAMYHLEPPEISDLLACLLEGRRIRDDLARIRANMTAQREPAEPFTAF